MINSILVPVDFSACSLAAVRYAARLCGEVDAKLTLLHVIEPHHVIAEMAAPEGATELEALGCHAHGDANAAFKEVAAELGKLELEVHAGCSTGHPRDAIVEAAAKCDLIVMGTHGRSGLRHVIMGSVAEQVIRRASCPVLVVRQ
ncbi:MAG: universal stress protein [Myxococcales bacterium]|nr:universal stress protein [Myxococcales bacterium]